MPEAGFRYDIGKFKCIVFSDGQLISKDSGQEAAFDLNCLFIDTGDHKILIDTGCGDVFQATAGKLAKNLEAAGIKCGDIDTIIFTHGHIDHAGGSFSSRGKPVFPNARYIAFQKEWEHWAAKPGNNELHNMFFSPARKNLLPIRDKFDLVKDNAEILPGIKLIAAPGHTPGNMVIEISSGRKKQFCVGDIIHSQQEFIDPKCLASFDVEPEQALTTRAKIFSDIAESGVLVFACHFPFPGLGHIRNNNGIFSWQAIKISLEIS
jgi:glyoxylase-like metal-dependent hydrolase (beta-lactamase superfamily II)